MSGKINYELVLRVWLGEVFHTRTKEILDLLIKSV